MSAAMSGREFKAIRTLCGFSAREVAEFLKTAGMPASTVRAVYRIEEEAEVPWRYVDALKRLVGKTLFDRSLREIRRRETGKAAEASGRGNARATIRSGRRSASHEGSAEASGDVEERFVQFLNALPVTGNSIVWITTFREALGRFLGDPDRIVINVNTECDLESSQVIQGVPIITPHIQSGAEHGGAVEVSIKKPIDNPTERLLADFRRQGYPLERYRPPQAYDYYFGGGAYLGTIFLWRELEHPPISSDTLRLMERIEPFIIFALSDLVARSKQRRPLDRAFTDALDLLAQSSSLTEQERRVVVLQLFGHSYEQIAERLHLSIDAVRKHVTSIYRKTGTHSYIELFAKYFTPRLGF
jgi:DNA-binding CsgD family transcriptional regulator